MKNLLLSLFISLYSLIIANPISDDEFFDFTLADSSSLQLLLQNAWELRSNSPIEAIRYANQAKSLAESNDHKIELARALNYLGVIHTNMGANEIALDYHIEALAKAKEADNWEQIGYSYNNIGGVYRIKNNIDLSSVNIFEAIKIFNEHNFNRGLAYCYLNLGRLYKDQENYKQSMKYLETALEQSKLLDNESIRAKILLEVADLLRLQGFHTSAENAYNELEEIYERLNQKKGLAEVWNSLCEININRKKFDYALTYIKKALQLNKEIINAESEIENLINLSRIYLATSRISDAEEILNEALNKASKLKSNSQLLKTFMAFYNFYKSQNNQSQALYYYEKYHKLNDSVVTKEEIVRLGELESLLRIEKAELQNAKLQNELAVQTTQRNYVMVIAFLAIIFVGLISYRFYEKKKLSDELEQINNVKDKFFRIIAHDLREPFNAIFAAVELLKDSYDEMTEEEKKEIIDSIGQSVKSDFDLLENLLLWASSQSDTIQFDPVELKLCKIIYGNLDVAMGGIKNKKINAKISCDDNLVVYADEQMLNTIVRNLLLNAVKFTHINGEININCRADDKQTLIEIKDSGIGMNEETLSDLFRLDKKVVSKGTAGETGSGLGLILTKEFINKHNGQLNVESKFGEGSKFTIIMPNHS